LDGYVVMVRAQGQVLKIAASSRTLQSVASSPRERTAFLRNTKHRQVGNGSP